MVIPLLLLLLLVIPLLLLLLLLLQLLLLQLLVIPLLLLCLVPVPPASGPRYAARWTTRARSDSRCRKSQLAGWRGSSFQQKLESSERGR